MKLEPVELGDLQLPKPDGLDDPDLVWPICTVFETLQNAFLKAADTEEKIALLNCSIEKSSFLECSIEKIRDKMRKNVNITYVLNCCCFTFK